MVMIFQSEKARKHLLEKGFVFTFRTLEWSDKKLGKNWINAKRGGKKITDVIICLASMPLYPNQLTLSSYVFGSGFVSVDEWIDEIKKLNKSDEITGLTGEIYCVVNHVGSWQGSIKKGPKNAL